MNTLKRLLTFIRSINLTAIATAALTGVSGAWGWAARVVGPFVFRFLEGLLDNAIKRGEDSIDQTEADKELEKKAKQNTEGINNAKTDDDFDNAARDSLKHK